MQELRERLKERSTLIAAISIDTLFIIVWLAVQVVANAGITWLVPHTDTLTQIVLWVLQVAFAAITIFPVGLFIYEDIQLGIRRTQMRILHAEQEEQSAITGTDNDMRDKVDEQ